MAEEPLLADPAKINKLARTLAGYSSVSQFDQDGEIEGGTLSHAFSDIEQSFRKFLSDLLPQLTQGNLSERDAQDVLLSIGEEFRHINYHLHDNKFYRYLWEDRIPDG